LADRALRQVNPLLGTVARLLELADGRVTAAQVLDLVAWPPVRRRFGFDDDDLERLRDLVVSSGARWGLDAEHRSAFRLGDLRPNTWAAGLDRILLGVAMSEDELCWLDTALPLDDVDSSDVDLVGRLAEFVDRLGRVLDSFTGRRSLAEWFDAIVTGVDALTAVPDSEIWQATQLRGELAEVSDAAAGYADRVPLALADVRSLLGERLRGRPTRANFRTGELTVCTMVPMRSVPHRVICVLGLDEGSFPRTVVDDGDDVLARDPCVGERDRRSEDRQLLLDAVLAASEYLVLLYTGADERTNARRPPAVPLDEFLDAIDATVGTADGRPAREHVLVRHPLQAFDGRNFVAGALGSSGPFSFDRAGLAGAAAAAGPREATPGFLAAALPPPPGDGTVRLDDLRRFLEHPVRGFLRQRLQVTLFSDDMDPADGMPVELDALERWNVGDRLLRARIGGADRGRAVQAEWRRGTVPPGPLGQRLLDRVADEVDALVAAALPYLAGDPDAWDVLAPLPDGRSVTGTVTGVYRDTLAAVEYSKLGPKHRLRAWVRLLALSAGRPGRPWRAVTIGRGQGRPSRSTIGPIDPATAAALLADLVAVFDEGLREPLPLSVKTSAAYAQYRARGGDVDDAVEAARKQWTRYEGGGEADDPAHALVWGSNVELDALLATPAPDRSAVGEPTRFGALAARVWTPLLAAETVDRA
jgi:exodeoxyribonuclease V gamma subunit